MTGMQWVLDIALIGLLAATLFHALRLERALGVLKRDRGTLEELVAGFNGATQQAEAGVDRLREAVDGAGRQIARQIETAQSLKEDLQFLGERGDRLADRLDVLVRAGRAVTESGKNFASVHTAADAHEAAGPRVRSQAERDLLKALRVAR